METLLVFLAIIAIQMIAAYSKQKKEAEKKAARNPAAPPREASPVPDPFREIREYMGLPPAEEETGEEPEETFFEEKIPLEQEYVREGFAPDRLPFESAAKRKMKTETHPQKVENLNPVPSLKRENALAKVIDINRPEQGIIWNIILQEPRYRVKWKPGRR